MANSEGVNCSIGLLPSFVLVVTHCSCIQLVVNLHDGVLVLVMTAMFTTNKLVSDIAIFVLKRDVKLQLTTTNK